MTRCDLITRFRRGFTLIELLIVVAIIAVLAAIAVPNFLEAQTRSKVSRSKADMRSIGVALEAYIVNHNRYPPKLATPLPPELANADGFPGLASWVPQSPPRDGASITTPISYMSEVPDDVFAEGSSMLAPLPGDHPMRGFRYFRVKPFPVDPRFNFFGNGSDIPEKEIGYGVSDEIRLNANPLAEKGGAWFLIGYGPDTEPFKTNQNFRAYDPTNGTVSPGDIYYTQGSGFVK